MTRKASFYAALSSALSSILLAVPLAIFAQDGKLLHLSSGAFDPLDSPPRAQVRASEPEGDRIAIVQFSNKAGANRALVENLGLSIVAYVPEDAYVVKGPAASINALGGSKQVRWIGDFLPEYKLSQPAATMARRGDVISDFVAVLWPGADGDQAMVELKAAGAVGIELRNGSPEIGARIYFTAAASVADQVAQLSSVQWIEPAPVVTRRVNETRPIVQSGTLTDTPLYDNDLFGEGQIIGHIDGDINYEHCLFRDDELTTNTPGPNHRKILAHYGGLHPLDPSGTSHGTKTASVLAGESSDPGLTIFNAGVAPLAKIVHGYDLNLSKNGGLEADPEILTLYEMMERHYNDGAHIHSNSYGDDGQNTYTIWCQEIDAFSYDYEDAMVVFAATNLSGLRTPENAKNVLAVGATKKFPNIDQHNSGGTGPTNDGRRKPEIFAPGQNVSMADYTTTCGMTAQGGTSFAAPAVAGAGALAREYYMDGFYPTGSRNVANSFIPSGSLLRATLLNGTVDMTGVSGYPSNVEGWGRLVLDNSVYFAGDTRRLIIKDVRHADGFTASDQASTMVLSVSSGEPLKITLVWPDRPAALFANPAIVNNLDLKVTAPNGTDVYYGNFFSGGQSVAGGTPDAVNTVEQVLLNSPAEGLYTLEVIAANIPMGPQGYALAISGDVTKSPGSIVEQWWLFR